MLAGLCKGAHSTIWTYILHQHNANSICLTNVSMLHDQHNIFQLCNRMSREQRSKDNWALLYACEMAQKTDSNVVVCFNLVSFASTFSCCALHCFCNRLFVSFGVSLGIKALGMTNNTMWCSVISIIWYNQQQMRTAAVSRIHMAGAQRLA